ncbi:MAG: HAMP domain-containing sensor histidine kinase [Candidatus Paceibacterota bacterium]
MTPDTNETGDLTDAEKLQLSELLQRLNDHDASNALTVIESCLILIEGNSDVDKELVKKAANALSRLRKILNCKVSSITDESVKWQPVAESFQSVAIKFKSIEIEINLPRKPEIAIGPILDRVFYVLVDNAINRGKATRMTVSAEVDQSTNDLLIFVKDNGRGIDQMIKERIFDKGVGENTGLGLFFARGILLMKGIKIQENGKPGHGACFILRVPPQNYKNFKT